MKKTMIKQTIREIRKSLNRLVALIAIVAIGTAFYTGLNAVGPDMVTSLTHYYQSTQFMDAKLVSTIGFNHEDVKQIEALKQVNSVMPGYSMDVIQSYGNSAHRQSNVAHLISIPKNTSKSSSNDSLNRLTVVHGGLPKKQNEAVVDEQKSGSGPVIGDTVTLSSGTEDKLTDKLHKTHFKIVGVVRSPTYLTRDRGSSKIGNGKVSGLLFIPEQTFDLPAYTEVYATINGANALPVFSAEYDAKADSFDKQLDNLAKKRTHERYKEMIDDANNQMKKKKDAYHSAKKKQQQSLADADDKIASTQKQVDQAQTQLDKAKKDSSAQIKQAQQQIEQADKSLAQKQQQYQDQVTQLNRAQADAQQKQQAAKQQLNQLDQKQQAASAQFDAMQHQLTAGSLSPEQTAWLTDQIKQTQQVLTQLTAQKSAIQQQLDGQTQQLTDTETQLKSAKNQLDASAGQLTRQKQKLAASRSNANDQFVAKQKQIDASQSQLAKAKEQASNERKTSDQKLAVTKKKIDDAQKKIDDIKKPKWHHLDRADNIGYSNYQGGTERTQGLANILPAFFFMIAALVVLTTMTRMVDEQRAQIGMLKALGYRQLTIAFKYLAYAAVSSMIGSMIGSALGFTLLPSAMAGAYKSLYAMPPMTLRFYSSYALIAFMIVTVVTTLATYLTCAKTLASVPSELMRAQAPKAGKRIFLENIHGLWKRMSFSQKVTVRNLFRYKKRFWMTVLGVTGCTAMLLAGLGLKDSISTQVSQRQFEQLWTYDMTVQANDSSQADTIEKAIKGKSKVDSITSLMAKSITKKIGGQDEQITMMVPSDAKQFATYIHLTDPKTGHTFALPKQGAVLSEKLAKMLHVKKGSHVHVNGATLEVSGITENYLGHFIYLSPSSYQQAYNDKIVVNQFLAKFNDSSKMSQSTLSSSLMDTDGVTSVRFTSDNVQEFNDIVKSLNSVVGVIILSASLLAFVVLYTLTTINISERFNEIATIKVLGFYDKEVSRYIYRESYLLTLFGVVLGLATGVLLHRYILNGVEVDQVMFVKHILPQSYIISAVMAFLFTWIVNQLSLRRVKKIDMIEALKGND